MFRVMHHPGTRGDHGEIGSFSRQFRAQHFFRRPGLPGGLLPANIHAGTQDAIGGIPDRAPIDQDRVWAGNDSELADAGERRPGVGFRGKGKGIMALYEIGGSIAGTVQSATFDHAIPPTMVSPNAQIRRGQGFGADDGEMKSVTSADQKCLLSRNCAGRAMQVQAAFLGGVVPDYVRCAMCPGAAGNSASLKTPPG